MEENNVWNVGKVGNARSHGPHGRMAKQDNGSYQPDTINIERVFLQRKHGAALEPMVVISSSDDVTIVVADHGLGDRELVLALLDISDNATLEEMFYFCEMKEMPIVVDGKYYGFHQVKAVVACGNTRALKGQRREADEPNIALNVSKEPVLVEKENGEKHER